MPGWIYALIMLVVLMGVLSKTSLRLTVWPKNQKHRSVAPRS